MSVQTREETINRQIEEADNGFKLVRENSQHSIYENGRETGAGATGTTAKLVTPGGYEIENLEGVFEWLVENYRGESKSKVTMESQNVSDLG